MRMIIRTLVLGAIVALAGCSGSDNVTQPTGSDRPQGGAQPLGVSGPDLVITSFQVTAITANSVSYSWVIMNVGDQPADLEGPTGDTADNVSVQALLSQDTIFGNAGDMPAGGTVVGSSPIAPLGPGETLAGSFSSGTPGAVPCDFANLTLMVDWGQVLVETNEANNFASAPLECCPDMVIDIKPGSDVNPVNPKSKGVIPVAILGSQDLDVTDIDISTVTFGPSGALEAHSKAHYEDVNGDGYTDLVLHFRTQDTGIQVGDTEACLNAVLGGDVSCSLSACDNIRTVPVPDISGP